MKTVPPQHVLPSYYTGIIKQLDRIFYDILFQPLLVVLNIATTLSPSHRELKVSNEMRSALRDALRLGRVQYAQHKFTGKFNAAISNEIRAMGGIYDERGKYFRLDTAPAWIVAEAAAHNDNAKKVNDLLKKKLNEMQANLSRSVDNHPVDATQTVDRFEQGWKPAAKVLQVNPKISTDSKQKLAKDYTENMKLWINEFSSKEIQSLRDIVEDNANEGYRYDALIEGIKKRYRVTSNHARFLARQETSLYMSKFHEQQFAEAGVRSYIWSTSHDERVRSSHRHLDGRVFQYADPPITDTATGAKNNPGEDFNCRCVAIAVFAEDKRGQEGEAHEYRELVHGQDHRRSREAVAV